MPDETNEPETTAEAEAQDNPFVPNPTDLYGHIDLRSLGDAHLVQQTPVFAQARALALDPEANLADVADSGPNLAGFDLTANEPVTVLDGEAVEERRVEELRADRERQENLAASNDEIEDPGTGPSVAGVRPGQNADAEDKDGVRGAAKKVADKVGGRRPGVRADERPGVRADEGKTAEGNKDC